MNVVKNEVDIPKVLPHRYPFLMVDRVVEIEPGHSAKGYKNVSWNEWYITEDQNHMPSMMIVEALAQLGAFAAAGEAKGLGFLTSFKNIEFLGYAVPGDRVDLYYEVIRNKRGFVVGKGIASVNETVIVRAEEIMVYTQAT
ncbi:3-hydroxyacyl-[acyl-carrier-protein] dehydratase FabZ [compost metagenome]